MAINNEPTIQPRTVTGIFTNYIAKVLPLAFDESMSYYECLCALLKYINDTIVPDINNTNAGLGELQGFYTELQSYVNNYFTDLNVQTQINNKLDAMVEDGTMDEIINNEILDNKIDCKANYHTDWNGSTGHPFCEIGVLGSTAAFHLLAGTGISANYVMGIGVDHGTSTGLVSSVKSSDGAAIGIGATLETTAADTASAMVIQKFSEGYGLRLRNGNQPTSNGKPLFSAESIYGATGDIAQFLTPTVKKTFKSTGWTVTEAWSSAAAVSTENPTIVTIDSGIGTNYHYQFARVGANAYYGICTQVNSNVTSEIKVTSNPSDVTIDIVRSNPGSASWQTMIKMGTNTMGFFGANPVTRRQVVSPSVETLNTALVQLGLISNT